MIRIHLIFAWPQHASVTLYPLVAAALHHLDNQHTQREARNLVPSDSSPHHPSPQRFRELALPLGSGCLFCALSWAPTSASTLSSLPTHHHTAITCRYHSLDRAATIMVSRSGPLAWKLSRKPDRACQKPRQPSATDVTARCGASLTALALRSPGNRFAK